MGKHTEYWQAYSRARMRDGLRVAAVLGGMIIVGVQLNTAKGVLGGLYPVLCGALVVGCFALLVVLGRRSYAVVCPECATAYQRTKLDGQCPTCGLKVLQPDP